MSNSTQLLVNVVTIYPFKDNMFEEFISIDSDFSENEEYYNEGTLELGYRSEAHRLSREKSDEFSKEWNNEDDTNDEYFAELISKYLEDIAQESYTSDTQFILGNISFTRAYEITPIFNMHESMNYNDEITVVVSYITV